MGKEKTHARRSRRGCKNMMLQKEGGNSKGNPLKKDLDKNDRKLK